MAIIKYKLVTVKCKREAIPVLAWTGPEGSKTVRLPDFKL
jgi:hypothetical protein